MKHITKKQKSNKNNVTQKINKGGIGPLPPLSEEKEQAERQRAVDLIKEILVGMNNGQDIIQISEPKVTERKKTSGVNSEIRKVFINGKNADRRALSYMFAEITGIDKFRINHTTTSGEYKSHTILGNKMRNVADLMNGVEYVKGKDTVRLFGIRDFLREYLSEYTAKYLQAREQRSITKDLLDSSPIHVKKTHENIPTGVLESAPLDIDKSSHTLLDPFFHVNDEHETKLREPFLETDQEEAPKHKKIKTKILLQKPDVQDEIEEPFHEDQEEKPVEVVVEKPILERTMEPSQEVIPEPTAAPETEPLTISKSADDDDELPDDEILKTDEEAAIEMGYSVANKTAPQTETRNILLEKERAEFEANKENKDYDFLYPSLNDPNFNIKIAKRKEFYDTSYNGTIYDIKKQAEILCNADFELMPHQLFVKNFLSFQTPYNSLLLYHSLGTGKTCSAIGVAEEMRAYMKQVGITQRIIVVASPNVKANFRMQLFDETKLRLENGLWNLNTCIGRELLSEINPTSMKDIPRERVISQINAIINSNYVFMGYRELANYIGKVTNISDETGFNAQDKKSLQIKKIKKNFNNRLIIIDEVHNIRITDDNKEKRTAELLMTVAKHSDNLRLLLLSATPMYNNYKEIIWLLNLINANDKRATIAITDIFDKEGNFKPEKTLPDGRVIEGGKEILMRKLTGYVSYVRGENPYTFPYRIYPETFSKEHSIKSITYPTVQMNGKQIEDPIQNIPVYVSSIGEYQQHGYDFIMNYMKTRTFNRTNAYGVEINMPNFENMDGLGYTLLLIPLEALDIVYPSIEMDKIISKLTVVTDGQPKTIPITEAVTDYTTEQSKEIIDNMIGKRGLANVMSYKTVDAPHPLRHEFEYKPEIAQNYGRIFARENIGKYSNKISSICESVMNSKGVIIVYSQYIDGGGVPIALALEEMGFARWGAAPYTKSLFKAPPTEPIDAITMKPKSQVAENFRQAKYVMLTGDKYFSPDNSEDIKQVVSKDNKNGELVKVVIISMAASEGLDFKNIRQIHILEPWYNMNRVEQIIGRGVRNLSHCALPFEDRNVEIYLHGTTPRNNEEPADLYVYRLAEKKAKQIGEVTRLLKETAVDCILNIGQTNFTVDKLLAIAENKNIKINLSSSPEPVDFQVGDRPYTDICDYKECDMKCSPFEEIKEEDVVKDTYNEDFVKMNYSMILKRIRELFKEQSFYKWDQLRQHINRVKEYPIEQIYYTLSQFIENKNEYLIDRYGRRGYLINKGEFYAFQPIEVNDENASIFDRTVPVDYKHESFFLELPQKDQTDNTLSMQKGTIAPVAEETAEPAEKMNTYEEILKDMELNIGNALVNEPKIETGETDWYKHASKVILELNQVHGIPLTSITKYLVYHYLDTLTFSNKMILIKHIYSKTFEESEEYAEIEETIKLYFDEKLVEYKTLRGIVLGNNNKCQIYVQSGEDHARWEEAKQTDKQKLSQFVIDKYLIPAAKHDGIYVGFMHKFKGLDIVFKVKDMNVERSTGARFENEKKGDIIKVLNKVLGERVYTAKNTEKIFKNGLCVVMEMLLRHYTDTDRNGKVWFFDVEKTIMNKISS
jgi:superfamily II DNA or RNA helicase